MEKDRKGKIRERAGNGREQGEARKEKGRGKAEGEKRGGWKRGWKRRTGKGREAGQCPVYSI